MCEKFLPNLCRNCTQKSILIHSTDTLAHGAISVQVFFHFRVRSSTFSSNDRSGAVSFECEQTVRIAVNASEIKSPRSESDYAETTRRHVQRAITYANTPPRLYRRFYTRCVCAREPPALTEKKKTSIGIFHRGRRRAAPAHVLRDRRRRSTALRMRVSIKFHSRANCITENSMGNCVIQLARRPIEYLRVALAHTQCPRRAQ